MNHTKINFDLNYVNRAGKAVQRIRYTRTFFKIELVKITTFQNTCSKLLKMVFR